MRNNNTLISFKLFDKISTETEFLSKLSFVFCFLFWEKKRNLALFSRHWYIERVLFFNTFDAMWATGGSRQKKLNIPTVLYQMRWFIIDDRGMFKVFIYKRNVNESRVKLYNWLQEAKLTLWNFQKNTIAYVFQKFLWISKLL